MKICVFEVSTRMKGEQGITAGHLWSSYDVLARTAFEAIRVAGKLMKSKEYVVGVKLIAELD